MRVAGCGLQDVGCGMRRLIVAGNVSISTGPVSQLSEPMALATGQVRRDVPTQAPLTEIEIKRGLRPRPRLSARNHNPQPTTCVQKEETKVKTKDSHGLSQEPRVPPARNRFDASFSR